MEFHDFSRYLKFVYVINAELAILTSTCIFDEHMLWHGDLGRLGSSAQRRVKYTAHPYNKAYNTFRVKCHLAFVFASTNS